MVRINGLVNGNSYAYVIVILAAIHYRNARNPIKNSNYIEAKLV